MNIYEHSLSRLRGKLIKKLQRLNLALYRKERLWFILHVKFDKWNVKLNFKNVPFANPHYAFLLSNHFYRHLQSRKITSVINTKLTEWMPLSLTHNPIQFVLTNKLTFYLVKNNYTRLTLCYYISQPCFSPPISLNVSKYVASASKK